MKWITGRDVHEIYHLHLFCLCDIFNNLFTRRRKRALKIASHRAFSIKCTCLCLKLNYFSCLLSNPSLFEDDKKRMHWDRKGKTNELLAHIFIYDNHLLKLYIENIFDITLDVRGEGSLLTVDFLFFSSAEMGGDISVSILNVFNMF